MDTQFEKEEQQLEDDLAVGNISLVEYNRELREMQRSYRAEAEEAAEDAYRHEFERW